MNKTNRRLGRGLDSLVTNLRAEVEAVPISTPSTITGGDARASKSPPHDGQATRLPVGSLEPNPFQPRQDFRDEDIQSLARSLQTSGMLQPIVVRYKDGAYEIVAGERRWRAAKSASITHVPVIIRQANDQQMIELALIENIQREDLNPIERARAYRAFCDRFGLSAEQVAERLGEDRSTVANYMRLLELPSDIMDLVAARQLTMGHARCLLGVASNDRRLQLAESAARHELSVRALEDIVRRERVKARPEGTSTKPEQSIDRVQRPHLRELQTRFEQALQTKVTIREGKKRGSGRIVIQYYSLDDFDRVADRLGVQYD